jgi:hypothetical protein
MNMEFFDRQDSKNPNNGTVVRDEKEIVHILDSLQEREPFFCELVGQNGYNLLVGIGTVGCVQYSHNDGRPPHLMATAPNASPTNDSMRFLIGNTTTPISTRYGLPLSVVRDVVLFFQKTGGRSLVVCWEEI